MKDEGVENSTWHCLFCRMSTRVKLFGIPVCPICRDQLQDFVWVSAIQTSLVSFGLIGGMQFAVEEVLLFGVLVLVKHRMPGIFDRFVQGE